MSRPCPDCGKKTTVFDTRYVKATDSVRRRHKCPKGHRFTTIELHAHMGQAGRPYSVVSNYQRQVCIQMASMLVRFANKVKKEGIVLPEEIRKKAQKIRKETRLKAEEMIKARST